MTMTPEERLDLRQVKNAKAIRVAIYDAALLIGGVLLIDKAVLLLSRDLAGSALLLTSAFIGGWAGCIIQRYRDWRSITWIEEKLGEHDLEERLNRLD